jgi:hypothetical protein
MNHHNFFIIKNIILVVGSRIFCLLHIVHIGCGAQPASYSIGTGDCFCGAKAAGA